MVKTGSVQDGKFKGLSHLLEHMFYVGTQKYNSEIELKRKLESNGSIINGSTAKEYTAYYITLHPNKLLTHIKLLAEMIKFSTIDGYNLEDEKNVVYNELNMRTDKLSSHYYKLSLNNIYKNAIYKDFVAGSQKTIKPIEKHHLLAYIKSQYLPSNCIFSIRGKINYKLDELLALVKEEFGGKDLFAHYNMKNTHIKYKDYMNTYNYFQTVNKNINNDMMRKKFKYNWGFHQIVDNKALQSYVYIYFEGIPAVKNSKIETDKKISKYIRKYLNFGLSGKLKEDIRCKHKLIYNMGILEPNHAYNGLFNIQYNIRTRENNDIVKSLEIVMENLKELKMKQLTTKTLESIYVQNKIKQTLIEDNVLNDTIDKCEEYVFANINSQYYKNQIKKTNSSKTKKTSKKTSSKKTSKKTSTKKTSKKTSGPTITPKQIQDYAQQIFDSSKMNIFIVSPSKINLNFAKIKKML